MNHLVKRTKPNFWIVACAGIKGKDGLYINNGIAGSIQISPGVNTLTEEEYKVVAAHPHWEEALDKEEMIVLTTPAPEKGKEDYELSGMTPKAAIKVVTDTVKADVLTRWQSKETRGDVTAAIVKQLKKIEPPPPKDGTGDGDDKSE